jgi:hypothetical protein
MEKKKDKFLVATWNIFTETDQVIRYIRKDEILPLRFCYVDNGFGKDW